MMQIKKDTYNQLYDVSLLRKGLLNIGLCPGRGLDMFTAIYPELHRSMTNPSRLPLPPEIWMSAFRSFPDPTGRKTSMRYLGAKN